MENCSHYTIFCFYTFFKGIKEEDIKPVSLKKKNPEKTHSSKQNKTKKKNWKKFKKKGLVILFHIFTFIWQKLKKMDPLSLYKTKTKYVTVWEKQFVVAAWSHSEQVTNI